MTFYKETILDIQTGEVTKVEFTPKELKEFNANLAEHNAKQEALVAEELAKQEAKQAALSKLAALGLTPEEIAAITGA